jgi:lipopolysaccharide/colanic/teichoic acid biosynthesis glycosyltransferase
MESLRQVAVRAVRSDISRKVKHLPGPAQMAAVLARHRARADRTGKHFSLVVVKNDAGRRRLYRLAKALLTRARLTDEVGLLAGADDCVCAVLPDTDPSGAHRFMRDVCEKLRFQPTFAIYSYPENDNDNEAKPPPPSKSGGAWRRHEELETVAWGGEPEAAHSYDSRGGQPLRFTEPLPAWKRALDVTGALLGITFATPMLLAAAAAIKLTSPGPVIFRQKRSGLGGSPFTMYKFRTMYVDAEHRQADLRQYSEQDGPAFKMTNDPRVTRIGRFLRRTSIDELPQLFNVLKGDMCLVGPRPLAYHEALACEQWHNRRFDVTPGLTCIWQVEGRSQVSFADWMRMDARYAGSWTLRKDLTLLLRTIPAILFGRGAR